MLMVNQTKYNVKMRWLGSMGEQIRPSEKGRKRVSDSGKRNGVKKDSSEYLLFTLSLILYIYIYTHTHLDSHIRHSRLCLLV